MSLKIKAKDCWKTAAEIEIYPKYHSTETKLKRLLIVLPEFEDKVYVGWYFGGRMKEWKVDDSPSNFRPTHWQPLPNPPKP